MPFWCGRGWPGGSDSSAGRVAGAGCQDLLADTSLAVSDTLLRKARDIAETVKLKGKEQHLL